MSDLISLDELYAFIKRAGQATYAGKGHPVPEPERPGFVEYVFEDGDLSYRDSYTGYLRSRGMEVVRLKEKPLWANLYGGGMEAGHEEMARETFDFLRKALSAEENGFKSFRGPRVMKLGHWEYRYEQEGDVEEFNGIERISFQKVLRFSHRTMGGLIKSKIKSYL
jgi:hypothetical protein